MPVVPWYHSNSPGSILSSAEDFIIHLNDIAPNFGLPENEITHLRLVTAELKNNCEKARDNRHCLRIAAVERNRRMLDARNNAVGIIKLLKSHPGWNADCDEARKLSMMQYKMANTEPGRSKGYNYSNQRYVQIRTQVNFLNEILTARDRFFVPTSELEVFQAAIAVAEKALNKYQDIYLLQTTLLAEQSAALFKLKNTIKSVIFYLQDSKAWTIDHAQLLNIYYLTHSQKIIICTPVFEVRDCEKYVCINFAKIGINGMTVYARSEGETDFTFLDYATRTGYKDPRPVSPYVSEIREYRLNAVVDDREIGQPSDIKSIRVGGYKEVRTLPRI